MKYIRIPIEIQNNIFYLANNKCNVCHIYCKIPYKKLNKYYYCSHSCLYHT